MSRPFESLHTTVEDADLLSRMGAGDETALGALYDRYSGMLYAFALRMFQDGQAAEEAVQNTFLAAWRNAASFDARRGKASTWLVAILKNQVRDQMRRSKRKEAFLDDLERDLAAESGPVDHLDALLLAGEVRDAVRRLPPEQRVIIELTYFFGLSHRETATLLRIPLGTVKSRLRLAIERMGDMFDRGRRSR